MISDNTIRSDQTCRTYEPATPVALGPDDTLEPRITMNLSGGTFEIHRTTVVLEAA